jgi:EKC/KEOPS complex subunit CGI121/TPRKB
MMLQTFHLSHLPPSLAVHVALFRDLRNASYLRQQLLNGKSEFEYALIDASVVSKLGLCLIQNGSTK